MDRAQKAEAVEELGKVFADSGAVIVCEYKGMTVAEMQDFRAKMREAEGKVQVAKNRLAKIALKDQPSEGLGVHLKGQTLLAYHADPVSPAKVVAEYAKGNEKLKIIGGAMGAEIMDAAGVIALSKMPSREEVLASIVGAIMAPGANIAGALTAPGANIASCLESIAEKQEENA